MRGFCCSEFAERDYCWSMDFGVNDLFNSRDSVLGVMAIFSRERVGIKVNQGIKWQDVVLQIKFVRMNIRLKVFYRFIEIWVCPGSAWGCCIRRNCEEVDRPSTFL
jgi:hypothetical protein